MWILRRVMSHHNNTTLPPKCGKCSAPLCLRSQVISDHLLFTRRMALARCFRRAMDWLDRHPHRSYRTADRLYCVVGVVAQSLSG